MIQQLGYFRMESGLSAFLFSFTSNATEAIGWAKWGCGARFLEVWNVTSGKARSKDGRNDLSGRLPEGREN